VIRSTQVFFALAALALCACGTGTNYRDRASDARQDANQEEANALQDADQKVEHAAATEERQLAGVHADFEKDRESYRHDVETNLIQVDKDIADLDAKAKTADPNRKSALEANLRQIRNDREAYDRDSKALETVSSDDWAELKARLDREWDALKALVNGA
jgi:predicted negative regulator of RcsB-dependent stress response